MIPITAPDDTSRETELAFTDGCWLGDALPLDDFAVSALGPPGAVLVGVGALPVAAAAAGLEDVPEGPSWLTAAATPGEAFVGLRGVSVKPRYKGWPLPTLLN